MTDQRRDPFASLDQFKPKESEQRAVNNEDIDKISKDNGFLSREARPEKPGKRARFNSGVPKKQLNVKVTEKCFERFYEMAESRDIRVLGDLVEMALDALEQQEQGSSIRRTDK